MLCSSSIKEGKHGTCGIHKFYHLSAFLLPWMTGVENKNVQLTEPFCLDGHLYLSLQMCGSFYSKWMKQSKPNTLHACATSVGKLN